MERYALIDTVLPREFVLLQGQGCKWRRCTFCDYYTDVSADPFAINREVLAQVQGVYGVLDVINSGSAMELDAQFEGVEVKFRCGIESFDASLRRQWNKGVKDTVLPGDVARYFQGVCLLCCTEGDSRERILRDIALAKAYFEYASVNVFCENSTAVKRDEELVRWFVDEVYPQLKDSDKIEILINNTDLGVG